MAKYGMNVTVNVEAAEVFYNGQLVNDQYGRDISGAYARLDTARYLMESFEIEDGDRAFEIADKVRNLMAEHKLGEDEAINQILSDMNYFDEI